MNLLILNNKNIVYLFLLIFFCFSINQLWIAAISCDPYTQGDWLINYQDGGFKRRGLSGSVMFLLQDITAIRLQSIVFSVQTVFFMVFLFTFYFLLSKKSINLKFIVFLISPISFLFFFSNPEIIGRKEIILFSLFTLFALFVSNHNLTIRKENTILLLLTISIFMHELIIFYLPYFVLMKYIFDCRLDLLFLVKIVLIALFSVSVLYFYGVEINEGNSIALLKERGFEMKFGYGIFSWNEDTLEWINKNKNHYIRYVISITYGVFIFKQLITEKLKNKNILIGFVFCFVLSIPLFILAVDWGRWININFVLISIIFATTLDKYNGCENRLGENIKNSRKLIVLLIINFLFGFSHFNNGFSSSLYRVIKNYFM